MALMTAQFAVKSQEHFNNVDRFLLQAVSGEVSRADLLLYVSDADVLAQMAIGDVFDVTFTKAESPPSP